MHVSYMSEEYKSINRNKQKYVIANVDVSTVKEVEVEIVQSRKMPKLDECLNVKLPPLDMERENSELPPFMTILKSDFIKPKIKRPMHTRVQNL